MAKRKIITMADIQRMARRIVRLFDPERVILFGSHARGEAGPDSDVDFLVTFPADKSIFELVGLWLDLKELMGREVDLIADAIDDTRFLNRILKDAVTL